MLTCREVTEICAGEKPLTFWAKIKFRFHLLICRACSSYVKQIESLKALIKERSARVEAQEEEMIKQLKLRAIEKIKKGGRQ